MIAPGGLFTVTTGEYSDYCVSGVFRALKNIDVDSLLAQFNNDIGCKFASQAPDEFLIWAIREGYIEQVMSSELWLSAGYTTKKLKGGLTEYEGVKP